MSTPPTFHSEADYDWCRIEKAFRTSKRSRQASPSSHRTRDASEAPLSVGVAAMAVSHWIERQTGRSNKIFLRTGPWKTVEDVELATLSWVYWHNTSRLHSYLGDIPPAEFEAAFYDAYRTDQPLIGIQ